MFIEIVQWFCWIVMIVALGSIAVFMIFEPFWRRKGPTEYKLDKPVTIRGDANQLQDGINKAQAAVEKMVDTSRWHKRTKKVEISEDEMVGALRPEDMHRLMQERTLEWYEELKNEGLMIGAVEYLWDPMHTLRNPHGGELITVVANVIKA